MSSSQMLSKATLVAAAVLASIAIAGTAKAQSATEIQLSKTLKVEKVVATGGDATINVRAQKPGRYEFFDEYNEKVARGALVVK